MPLRKYFERISIGKDWIKNLNGRRSGKRRDKPIPVFYLGDDCFIIVIKKKKNGKNFSIIVKAIFNLHTIFI